MAKLTIVYWRNIPAQIIAESVGGRRRRRASVEMPERFGKAIDAAAMRHGATDSDSYLADWRRSEPVDCDENLEAAVQAEAERLDKAFDGLQLAALIGDGRVAE